MLSGFSLFRIINSQHELYWKKEDIIFVQDNLSEVYEILGVFGNWKVKTDVYVAGLWFLVRFGGKYNDYIYTLGCFSVMVASYEREES